MSRAAIGQVWRHNEVGWRVRVTGFTRIDKPPWVKVRDVGGKRQRSSFPVDALVRHYTLEQSG